MEYGFNEVQEDGTTRLGFDMVISKRNIGEVEKTLRYCRDNNLFVVFAFYIPSGRCAKDDFDRSLMVDEKEKAEVHLKEINKKIDELVEKEEKMVKRIEDMEGKRKKDYSKVKPENSNAPNPPKKTIAEEENMQEKPSFKVEQKEEEPKSVSEDITDLNFKF